MCHSTLSSGSQRDWASTRDSCSRRRSASASSSQHAGEGFAWAADSAGQSWVAIAAYRFASTELRLRAESAEGFEGCRNCCMNESEAREGTLHRLSKADSTFLQRR